MYGKTKYRFAILAILCGAIVGMSCYTPSYLGPPVLRLKGSDTMLPMARLWAEEYMLANRGMSIYVEGGGTATGAAALANGTADICMASRPLRPQEAQRLAENYNTVGISILVAKDALSVYVHPENPVQVLSLSDLKGIYQGEITNWSQLGGNDLAIDVVNRSPNSGTFLYFQQHVLGGENYTASSRTLPTTRQVVQAVAENPSAIGYGGIAYESDVAHCKINSVEPSTQSVADDTYPLTRYLYLYTVDTPRGRSKNFINWVISKEGQDIVKRSGYFPIWQRDRQD